MANRIYFANQAFGIAPQDTTSYVTVHGLQQGGLSTNFNIEYIQEIGQLNVYESVEDVPQIEITLQKLLDGYPTLWHLSTRGATSNNLSARGNRKCGIAASIYSDDQDAASGTPVSELNASGAFISSWRVECPVQGNCTEDITLQGNHVKWKTAGFAFTNSFDNSDQPLALASGLGGIQRRENVIFAGSSLSSVTLLPKGISGIPGISASGTNDKVADVYGAHVQRISIGVDLNREELNELGRKLPYFRAITFPVEVTCDIDVLSTTGNKVGATEEGEVTGSGTNLADQTIRLVLQEGLNVDLGTRNKLRSVSFSNQIGSNVVDTYSYSNQNYLVITHPQDPG